MFADHQGDQFTYNIWTLYDDNNWENDKELTRNIVIPRVSGHGPPATLLSSLAEFEHNLQFESFPKNHQRKTTKMTGKRNQKRASDRASEPGSMQHKKRKETPWTAQLNGEITLYTADLTEDESDYNDSLDPVSYLIR